MNFLGYHASSGSRGLSPISFFCTYIFGGQAAESHLHFVYCFLLALLIDGVHHVPKVL
jgi:hypothetical protein